VSGATVNLYRIDVAEPVMTTASAADGSYRFANVPRGIYRVEFTLEQRFEPLVHAGIVLLPGEKMTLNARLRPMATDAPSDRAKPNADMPPLMDGEVLVRLETPHGAIDLAIDTRRAPLTADNFLRYVDGGFYDGGQFHRVTRPDNYTPEPPDRPMMEIIQGGINPARRAQSFAPIALERTTVTGLKHVVGTVSMARAAGADTARSDFFILLDEQPSLDAGGGRFEDKQGAAAFGRVVTGLDVVRKIQQQPAKGDRLTPPVPISKAYRIRPKS
jgi:peptidyl-prolyl cis-trans isomerase A (cyclophilin A)